MKHITYRFFFTIFFIVAVFSTTEAQRKQEKPIPYLHKQNGVVQLMVDDKPFLILGGELHNSSASSPEHMKTVWPKMKSLNINTVIAPVYWELTEPEEGKYDFTLTGSRKSGPTIDPHIAEALRPFLGTWKIIVKNTPEGDVSGILNIHENISALSIKEEQFIVTKLEFRQNSLFLHLPFQGYESTLQLEQDENQTIKGILGELYEITGTR
jgi:hypothetical protein